MFFDGKSKESHLPCRIFIENFYTVTCYSGQEGDCWWHGMTHGTSRLELSMSSLTLLFTPGGHAVWAVRFLGLVVVSCGQSVCGWEVNWVPHREFGGV